MKTAVVTGAYGFVGKHLVPRLIEEGYHVTAVDISTNKPAWDYKTAMSISHCTALDAAELLPWKFRKREGVDLVVHLAANIVDVDKRMHSGLDAYNDVFLDYKICQWVEEIKPKCFVAMSSCAVDYPRDPYCIIKRNLESFASTLSKQGQRTIVLRPFSGYGFDQLPSYPFPSIMKRAHDRQNPLTVWGGPQRRDWLHIDDLVDSIIYAVNNFPSDIGPVELGTCRSISFYDLARMMAAVVGYTPTVEGDPTKESSSPERRAGMPSSGALLAHTFGWRPKIAIEDGIKIEYQKFVQSLSSELLHKD